MRTGQPSFVSSAEDLLASFADNERLRAFVETSGERSFARLPLLTPSGVMGALVFGFEHEREFSDADQRFMLALAGQCAQALERARLYERERGMARMLQRSLLPEALPLVIGMRLSAVCRAATDEMEVGGDWYDALVLDDGRVALVVGDVRGRGVRAASVMGQVRNALRGLVHADASPRAVLGWLDDVVAGLGDDEEFVTLVYAVADPRTGSLEWACAGHMPPLVVGADGARYLEGAESLPLGLGGERASTRLQLAPGESLVLFSDGLVENRHRPLGSGLHQLLAKAAALSASERVSTAESLRDELTAAMLDERGDDDVTVLTLRRAHETRGVGGHPVAAGLDLPARPTSPGTARRFVGARLGEWGAAAVLDQTLLCVSELVTNAVVHAGSPVYLELHCGEGTLRVDVRDTGYPVLAAARYTATAEDTHGRGLMMVDAVADRWGVVEETEGKVVWFEIAVPAA
ncbi:MAG TPA: SpoIIE family protein phosphatase [Actinomycetales bacterium]|nr:SpoIIE family protein phosphatase [Actinomycetales bacterium]